MGNSASLPSDVIDFTMFPAQRFWHCKMSCDLKVTNDSACCWHKIFSYITMCLVNYNGDFVSGKLH